MFFNYMAAFNHIQAMLLDIMMALDDVYAMLLLDIMMALDYIAALCLSLLALINDVAAARLCVEVSVLVVLIDARALL
jgi:hypothetical protein